MSIVFPYIFCLHICTSVEYIIYFIQNLMVSLREGCKKYCWVSLVQWGKPPPPTHTHTIWGPLIGGSNISVSSANRSLDCCQKHDDCMMTAWWLHVSLLRDLGANLNAKHKASWVWPLTHTHTATGPAGSAWMRFHAPVHDETGVDFGCIFVLVWFLSSFLMVHIADWGKFKVGWDISERGLERKHRVRYIGIT